MKLQLLRFLDDRHGGSAPEYALILAAVAAAVAIGLALFGSSLGNGLRASAQYVDRVALNFGATNSGAAGGVGPAATAAATPGLGLGTPVAAATASHGRSMGAHGHHGGSPGQSGDAPGHGGTSPGASGSAPGKVR